MDRTIARPDVFLAYYQSIIAEDGGEDSRLLVSTAMALTLVLIGSCLVCAVAVGVLS